MVHCSRLKPFLKPFITISLSRFNDLEDVSSSIKFYNVISFLTAFLCRYYCVVVIIIIGRSFLQRGHRLRDQLRRGIYAIVTEDNVEDLEYWLLLNFRNF